MSILKLQCGISGTDGLIPRNNYLLTTDTLAVVTAAGYLVPNAILPQQIQPTDIFDVIYSYNTTTKTGTYTKMVCSISLGVITLSQYVDGGDVLLPVVSGNIASFNGTSGQIHDSGVSVVNPVFTSASITNLKYGATPVAQVDPGSCTITAAAGAANHCTITIQLKDGSGTNMARVLPFRVYLATDATGLTLQSAASTGYSVTSGGVKDPTGSTTITQGLAAFSSATGGCVVDLLDTGKGTGNLILMLPNGFKASAAVTSGSYG